MKQPEFLAVLEEILEVDPGTVSMSDDLDELGWDSLSNLTFIAEMDTREGLVIDADALAKCTSPGALYGLLSDEVRSR